METNQWLADFESQLAGFQQKAADLQEGIAAATSTAISKDGTVTVTVGPNGGLQDLRLGHRAIELGAAKLTALILETVREAQREVVAKVHEAFEPLGEGTESMAMYMDAVPDDLDPIAESEDDHGVEGVSASAAPNSAATSPPKKRTGDDGDDGDSRPW